MAFPGKENIGLPGPSQNPTVPSSHFSVCLASDREAQKDARKGRVKLVSHWHLTHSKRGYQGFLLNLSQQNLWLSMAHKA